MDATTLGCLGLAVAEGAWLAAAAAVGVASRPRRPRQGPLTSELRDESPAVVNLLTHAWTVTASAAPATLLDLADRHLIEIVQVTPEEEVVQLRPRAEGSPKLRRYEAQVLDHLRSVAVDGTVPSRALTTGPLSASEAWWRHFRKSVTDEAVDRGLSRHRYPGPAVGILGAIVLVFALGLFLLFKAVDFETDGVGAAWPLGIAAAGFLACVVVAKRFDRTRQRDTPAGLAAASHWLGVRAGYASVDRYEDLPPAAVILYERHLAYAAAMDVAHDAIRRLPLGAEDDRKAWSSQAGRWRQVEVSYPRRRSGWGMSPAAAVASGLGWCLLLAVPLYIFAKVGSSAFDSFRDALETFGDSSRADSSRLYDTDLANRVSVAVFAVFAAVLALLALVAVRRGLLRLVRGLADIGRYRTLTGLVVRRRTFSVSRGDQEVQLHFAAVDDGTSDRIQALRLKPEFGHQVAEGDVVTVEISPRLGHVRALSLDAKKPPLPPPRAVEQLPPPTFVPAAHWSEKLSDFGAPDPQAERLLQFVQRVVNRRAAAGAPGPGAPPRSGPR